MPDVIMNADDVLGALLGARRTLPGAVVYLHGRESTTPKVAPMRGTSVMIGSVGSCSGPSTRSPSSVVVEFSCGPILIGRIDLVPPTASGLRHWHAYVWTERTVQPYLEGDVRYPYQLRDLVSWVYRTATCDARHAAGVRKPSWLGHAPE